MKAPFFARRALLIICVILFLSPFALRGARYAMQRMKNNVKDWLPSDFPETTDLRWFARHFIGEQFIVVTWPIPEKLKAEGKGLEDDPRFAQLVDKLRAEVAPPGPMGGETAHDGAAGVSPVLRKDFDQLTEAERSELDRMRARDYGDKLGLCTVGKYYENWGGRGEKWLQGDDDVWYFITPEGELYQWAGKGNLVGAATRAFRRSVLRDKSVEGKLVATFGNPAAEGSPNEFHEDPRKLTARLFKSVTTGPEVRDTLSEKNGALWPYGLEEQYAAEEARANALERLTGTLFGPDGKQTCILVTLSEPGKRNLRRVIGRPLLGRPRGKLLELADECGIAVEGPKAELKMGGPPVDNVAIDEEGQITLARLIGYSALVGIVISLICFRSVKVTMMIFFVGGLGAITSLGIVWWTGGSVDAILMSMPSLIYVLGLSGAVHIVNYYRDAAEEHGLESAPGRGLAHGWKPCALAALTTALGLMSLNTSNLIPIKKFGFYSAIGAMATLILLFTFLPSALELWPPHFHKKRKKGDRQAFDVRQKLLGFWEPAGTWIVRHYIAVTAACTILFVIGLFGLPKIKTCVHLIKLFDEDSKIISDYEYLEENLADLVPMELVVRVRPEMIGSSLESPDSSDDGAESQTEEQATGQPDEAFPLNFLERVEIADRLQRVLEETFGEEGQGIVGRGMSVATFAPELPPPGVSTVLNPLRGVMTRKLEKHKQEYLASDYLRIDSDAGHEGSELWRVSLRLGALMDIDYGQFVSELERAVEPVLTAYRVRSRILHGIDRQRDGDGVMKAHVAFLGVSDPTRSTAGKEEGAPDADDSQSADALTVVGEDPSEIDQTRIFTETLKDLMTCAGVYAKGGCWHDPDAIEVEDGYYTSDRWGDGLANAFDCVVLVRDHEDYDVDFIKRHARIFIDARDHVFYPRSKTAKTARDKGDPIHVIYTGLVPIVYKAQRTLLKSLVKSIGWAFVMIALVMMLLLRNGRARPRNLVNFRAGLLAMLPNVFPIVLIFGAMGHRHILVDIGTMMTASVAMGVAVDDTIHFLTWFRDGIGRGLARNEAIIEAYRRCAAAMTQTTLIGGLGLAVFALSTFTPTQYFGVMMLALLAAALVGDLVFLPALLAGPLGRYFCPPPSATQAGPATGGDDSARSPEGGPGGGPDSAEDEPADSGFAKPHMTDVKNRRKRSNYRTDRGHGRSMG